MTDQILVATPANSWPEDLKRALLQKPVADAPPDLDKLTAQIHPLPAWMRLLTAVVLGLSTWAAVIVGVAALLH